MILWCRFSKKTHNKKNNGVIKRATSEMLQNSRWKVWFFTTLSSHPFFFGVKQTNKKQQQKKNTNCTHTQKQVSIIIACFRHYKYFLPSYRNKEGSCQLFWHSDYFRPHRSTENVRTSRIKELRSRNGLAV